MVRADRSHGILRPAHPTLDDSQPWSLGLPSEYPEDALHIAVAAVSGIEVVITWNFAHLNTPFTRIIVRQIVEAVGYEGPEICSPEELLEVDK